MIKSKKRRLGSALPLTLLTLNFYGYSLGNLRQMRIDGIFKDQCSKNFLQANKIWFGLGSQDLSPARRLNQDSYFRP